MVKTPYKGVICQDYMGSLSEGILGVLTLAHVSFRTLDPGMFRLHFWTHLTIESSHEETTTWLHAVRRQISNVLKNALKAVVCGLHS